MLNSVGAQHVLLPVDPQQVAEPLVEPSWSRLRTEKILRGSPV